MSFSGQLVAQEVVEISIEFSLGDHAGLFLLECSAGGVAGISKEWLFASFALAVQSLEAAPGHQDFTPYLEFLWPVAARLQLQGNASDGTDVGGDIVALNAVATSDSTHQPSLLVVKRDAEAVEFQFTTDFKSFVLQSASHAFIEFTYFFFIIGVGQREHGARVQHRLEIGSEVAAHALSRGVGVEEFRMA